MLNVKKGPTAIRPGLEPAVALLLPSGSVDLPAIRPLSQKQAGGGYRDPSLATATDTIANTNARTQVQNLACLATVYTMIDRALGKPSWIDNFYPDPRLTTTESTSGAKKPPYVGSIIQLNVNVIVAALEKNQPTILHGIGGLLQDHYVLVVGAQVTLLGGVNLTIIDPWATTVAKPFVTLTAISANNPISYPALGLSITSMMLVNATIQNSRTP